MEEDGGADEAERGTMARDYCCEVLIAHMQIGHMWQRAATRQQLDPGHGGANESDAGGMYSFVQWGFMDEEY